MVVSSSARLGDDKVLLELDVLLALSHAVSHLHRVRIVIRQSPSPNEASQISSTTTTTSSPTAPLKSLRLLIYYVTYLRTKVRTYGYVQYH